MIAREPTSFGRALLMGGVLLLCGCSTQHSETPQVDPFAIDGECYSRENRRCRTDDLALSTSDGTQKETFLNSDALPELLRDAMFSSHLPPDLTKGDRDVIKTLIAPQNDVFVSINKENLLKEENWPARGFRKVAQSYEDRLVQGDPWIRWITDYNTSPEYCVKLGDADQESLALIIVSTARTWGVPRELTEAVYYDAIARFPLLDAESITISNGADTLELNPEILCKSLVEHDNVTFANCQVELNRFVICKDMAFCRGFFFQGPLAAYDLLIRATRSEGGKWEVDATWLLGVS